MPHEDLGQAIAQLSLWSSLAASIGSSIGTVVWENQMLKYMREACPFSVPSTTLSKIYGSIATLRRYEMSSDIRQCGITAYTRVNGHLFIATCCIAVVSIAFVFLLPDYYLGKRHNVKSNERPDGERADDEMDHRAAQQQSKSIWGRFWGFYRKETN